MEQNNEKDCKVISFINMKGGVGKTTLALNVASVLSKNSKVLVIDMDPQFNATQSLVSHRIRKYGHTTIDDFFKEKDLIPYDSVDEDKDEFSAAVGDFLENIFEGDRNVLSIFEEKDIFGETEIISKIDKNLYLVPGNLSLSTKNYGDTTKIIDGIKKFIESKELRKTFKYIIIDCPPTWSIITKMALMASDYYLLPMKIDSYSAFGVRLLQRVIKTELVESIFKSEIKPLGAVFSLVTTESKTQARQRERIKKSINEMKIFNFEIPLHPSAFAESNTILDMDVTQQVRHKSLINALEGLTLEIQSEIMEMEKTNGKI